METCSFLRQNVMFAIYVVVYLVLGLFMLYFERVCDQNFSQSSFAGSFYAKLAKLQGCSRGMEILLFKTKELLF